MNWVSLVLASLIGLLSALSSIYLLAFVPLPGIDRFAAVALAMPLVWATVCFHIVVSRRPIALAARYAVATAGLAVLPTLFFQGA